MDKIYAHIKECPNCQKWLERVSRNVVVTDAEKARIERSYCAGGGEGW